jgi:hypothetical protein
MYSLIGILFCVLEGILVAKFGWIALLWSPIGFFVGLFASSNIILPVLMGVPTAISHVSKNEMKSKVFLALLGAPIIWLILLSLFAWFLPTAVDWILKNETLTIGLLFGGIVILFSPLSKKARSDFRIDFDKSYGQYYTNQSNYNLSFTNSTDKVQLKQISAATTIFSNLYIQDFSPSFSSLNFEYPDSRFRCMVFCLSAVVKDCEKLIDSKESLQKECLHFLSTFTTSKENIKEFFTQSINAEQAERDGAIYLDEYLKKWETYYDNIRDDNRQKATEILCSMIRSIGTNNQIKDSDEELINQLCWQIEYSLKNKTMQAAFIGLLAKKN